MAMRKTIGGDRLGAGKKLQVELENFGRSTQDMGYLWRSTMAAGTLVPFLNEVALPGDTFDINLGCVVKTHPTVGPLFGSFKVQLDVFLTPMRLYNSLMHNNMLGIGLDMSQVKLPLIQLSAQKQETSYDDIDNSQVNPSCLLKYLGISGIGYNPTNASQPRNFNAIPILNYWEIYKNYYANKSEEVGAVLHTELPNINTTITSIETASSTWDFAPAIGNTSLNNGDEIFINYTGATPYLDSVFVNTSAGTFNLLDIVKDVSFDTGQIVMKYNGKYAGVFVVNWRYKTASDIVQGVPDVTFFPLSNIDQMRIEILKYSSTVAPFQINDTITPFAPYIWLQAGNSDTNVMLYRMCSQEGLGLKTYQSDLFNSWIQTEWFDGSTGINAITAIDTSSGEFTIDTLNLATKVYKMLNRIAVSGGSYNDWQDAVWGHSRFKLAESPMYCGGLSKELVFQEVISNAQSTEQPLGTLGGRGIMAEKHKGGSIVINVDEPSYVMGIVSLTPRVDYSQGNKWDVYLRTMNDLHKPDLDQIGFQDLMANKLAWWSDVWNNPELKWDTFAVGKQPAWLDYMTNVNRTYGNFAIQDNEMFMTLNRRYERHPDGSIADLTTYIDPAKFNHIFAETARDAQNFWTQIAVDMIVRRKISAKVMPNL